MSHPGVSVIMPILNEERHLTEAVSHITDQDYAGPVEVILAVGPSHDRTAQIAAELAAADPRIRVVDNPSGRTADGLNAAIGIATYDLVVRVDGHAMIPTDYVRTAVETLERTGADNVGGIMAAEGTTTFECGVAAAMTSWFGVGNAAFHIGGEEGPAPTVYLGAFRRSALERVGGYDSGMVRAQDWELNHRIRATGGLVWFTPELRVSYRPRGSVRALARQYFQYGQWRREIARRHPETLSPRYLAPPVAVAGVTIGLVGVAVSLGTGHPGWALACATLPIGYAGAAALATLRLGRGLPLAVTARLPLVFATMHGAWGLGFCVGARAED
jgi:glycosyltransferase involved in cell wall biosynthesis